MEIRLLLVTHDLSAVELNTAAAEVASDLAQRRNVAVTIETKPAVVFGRLDELARYHLIHLIGAPPAALLDFSQLTIPLVVTPTRHTRRSAMARHRRFGTHLWWLVHGRSNAARLVTQGIASGSQECSGNCADLPMTAMTRRKATSWRSAALATASEMR